MSRPVERGWAPGRHAFPADELDAFLAWAAERGASDVSFQTGSPAAIEVDGRLRRATGAALDRVVLQRLAERIHGPTADAALRSGRAIDCSYAIGARRDGRRRFRCNIAAVLVGGGFGVNITMRVLPTSVPTLDALGVEDAVARAWREPRGLTLVTGVPGSGKSTLLAAGTRRLLESGAGRVQSLEAPIEFVFDGIAKAGALMSSSEVPRHFETFADGLRASLRRRPAAVVVGEARDRETVEAVLRAADFGIAVFSTTHTIGVAATIRRLLAEFAPAERAERAAALVDVLHLVVTQVLFPNPKGGRTALREWLAFSPELKATLLETPLESWANRIALEVPRAGQDLPSAARAAFGAGLIDRAALARTHAAAILERPRLAGAAGP